MHALRAHCGSYLHDSLRQHWLTEEERRAMEERHSPGVQSPTRAADPVSGGDDQKECDREGPAEVSSFPQQWPLFGSPTLTTIRVTSYKDVGGTIYFLVQPTLEGFHWTVEKTYDDFAYLHRALVDGHGISKALLPSRRLFGYFGPPKPQYMKDLQVKLDQLLKAIVQKYPVPPKVLLEFLGYPFCDVLSITQILAIYFFEEGEQVLSNNKAVFMSAVQLHCIGQRMTLPIASSGSGMMRDDFGNLLDFLMQLKKLKIAPSTEDAFTLSPMEDVSFDLSHFKSLSFLAIDSIELKDLQNRQALTGLLEGLDVRRCLFSLQEVLVVYPADSTLPLSIPSTTIDLTRALKWSCLKKICFKLNTITFIDQSLKLLPCLECLDLTYNYITRIENLTELPHLKVVDLSHNKVAEVHDLHLSIGNISKLGLSHNQITSLAGFAKCLSLLYLDLSSNLIAEVSEVGHLGGLPVLEDLTLQGNPIKQSSSYRSSVFSHLPSTVSKVSLDGKQASQDELKLSASLAEVKGHRRVSSRTVDIRPDRYSTSPSVQDEFEVGTSVASRLEEMRKTGGDKWLSLLNTDRSQQSKPSTHTDDDVVAKGKERRKKHRKHHHTTPSEQGSDSPIGREKSSMATAVSTNPFPVEVEEEELSKELQDLIHQLQSEKLHLSDLPVTVLEYSGPLDCLSSQDVDQKLINSRLEECSVCVDTSVMRLLETVISTSRTRCQRDLALLEDIRFHEGRKKGVCLKFSQFSGSPFWVIYCVQDLGAMARLYVAVQQGLKSKQSPLDSVSLPHMTVSEETDSSPALVQSGPLSDSLLTPPQPGGTHGWSCNPMPTTTDSETVSASRDSTDSGEARNSASADIAHPLSSPKIVATPDPLSLSRSSEGVPAAVTVSGDTSPKNPRSRSRSPSPKPHQSSPKRWLSGRASPIAAVNSIVSAAKGAGTHGNRQREKQGAGSSASSSLEPSPVTSPMKAASTASSEVGSNKPPQEPLSSPVEKTVDSTTTSTTATEAVSAVTGAAERAVAVSATSTTPAVTLTSPPLSLTSVRDSKPTKLTTGARKMVKKPGIEREALVSFFTGQIAHERTEVLLNVLWCGASLTSTPGCEVESGLFVSDKGIYLLQVMDLESDDTLSWQSQNPPLTCSFHAHHLTLSQVKVGIFDQSVTFECIEKGAFKKLVVFPRTGENMLGLLDNLKAALDASRIPYCVTSLRESLMGETDDDGSSKVLFLNPDVSDLQKLKESLVKPRAVAHSSSHLMGYFESSSSLSFTEEIRKYCEDAVAKFEIVQYVAVSEVSCDLLPVSNGAIYFRPYVLVLTNSALYLCKDDIASWPTDPNTPVTPPLSRCTVLDSHPIESVAGIEICDRAQALVQISDPIYEFRISFCADDDDNTQLTAAGGGGSSRKWQLCAYDRQYIDQLFSCLQLLWMDVHHSTLTISYTAEPLAPVPLTPSTPTKRRRCSHSFSERQDLTAYEPAFYKSRALVQLAGLTSSERLQFFKDRVSEAQFMKSDEVPLAVFLGFCSTGTQQDSTQIEACVFASQYALYLVSDVDNIRKWLDGGGAASFSRMSLLNKQDSDKARCFFRLWINEIREVQMGFFYLSMRLKTSNDEHDFSVHSQDTSSMLALLSAFSCSTNLCNTAEREIFDELLSDYIDLGGDSLTGKAKHAQTNIEFRQPSEESLETLKQILLCISPSIKTSSSIGQSTSGLKLVLGQVMMMISDVNLRGTHTVNYQLELVLLSNYGLFVCANSTDESATPAVLRPSDLRVKRWCHIDLIEHVRITSRPRSQQECRGHVFSIKLQAQRGTEGHTLVLVAQNSEQLKHFLYHLSLLWHERSEKILPIYTV